jgi:hypothetical protein
LNKIILSIIKEKVYGDNGKYYDISIEYAWERLQDRDFKWDILDKIGKEDENIQKVPMYGNGTHVSKYTI